MVLLINPGSSARTKECSQLLSQLTSPACGFWVLINQRRLPAARGDRVPKREMLLGGWLGSQSQTSQHCEGPWLSWSSNLRGITSQNMGGLLERLNRILGRVLERVFSSERWRKPKGPPMETIIKPADISREALEVLSKHIKMCTCVRAHTHMNAHMHAPAHRHHTCKQKQYHMKANQVKLRETGQGELQWTSSRCTLLLSLLRAIFLLAALPAFAFPLDSLSPHSSSP